jgi:hypothetical protein
MTVASGVLLVLCAGCGKSGTAEPPDSIGVGCSEASAYELAVVPGLDSANTWFFATDATPGAVASIEVGPVNNAERCGGPATPGEAIVLSASGNRDWGCLFANWAIYEYPLSGAGYVGLAFWARTHGVSDAGVPFASDRDITVGLGENVATDQGFDCAAPLDGGPLGVMVDGQVVTVSGAPSCVSFFFRQLTVTEDWRLYLLPWQSFTQTSYGTPRSGVSEPAFNTVEFLAPPGAVIQLWIDDLGFYRANPAA